MLNIFNIKRIRKKVDDIAYELDYISLEDTCCAIYINANSDVLLVKQYRPILGRYSIEIPGGTKHEGEAADVAASREFNEETGLVALAIEPILTFFLSVGTSDEEVHLFHVKKVVNEGTIISSEKGVTPFWISKKASLSKISSGEIVDAKTIIALHSIFS